MEPFLYFFLLRAEVFDSLRSVLTASYRARSFAPCASLNAAPEGSLLRRLANVPFSRQTWSAVVGECLLYSSVDVPRLSTAPEIMQLLVPAEEMRQVYFGSRDLRFGGYYRPDRARYNDPADVARLTEFLHAQRPEAWSLGALADRPDRAEELADARAWWPELVALYERARAEGLIIVSEMSP